MPRAESRANAPRVFRGSRWNPDSGVNPNRGFVLASEYVWRFFHGRLRQINQDWHASQLADDEDAEQQLYAIALMREAERAELRKAVQEMVAASVSRDEDGEWRQTTGNFLIPV